MSYVPTVSFRVDRETYELLKKRANKENMTLSDLMRYMVEKCLGIEVNRKNDLEKRVEELERRVAELERLVKQQSGIGWYLKPRKR